MLSPLAKAGVLVVGGCGFVGFHVVKALLEEGGTWPCVHVMSRDPTPCNQLAGASYHVGDMTSAEQVRTLLDEIRPSTVIHAASPIATGNTGLLAVSLQDQCWRDQNLSRLRSCQHLRQSIRLYLFRVSHREILIRLCR